VNLAGTASDDPAGVHLTFIERVEGIVEPGFSGWIEKGKPEYDSSDDEDFEDADRIRPRPTPVATAVLATLPDIFKRISSVPFEGMGSLWPSLDTETEEPVLGHRYDRNAPPIKTFAEFLRPNILDFLEELRDGTRQVTLHYPDILYLSHLELLDLVDNDPDMTSPEPMYLDHGDGWQFMFDTELTRVKCILDWEL
jgi:hypothetical protein